MNTTDLKPMNVVKPYKEDVQKKQVIERFSSEFSKSKANSRGKVNIQI